MDILVAIFFSKVPHGNWVKSYQIQRRNQVWIKGADTAVLPNCTHGPVEETNKIVEQFAKEGLRTLVYAYKTITRDELKLFSEKLEAAKQSIVNR